MEDRELVQGCLEGRVEFYREIMEKYGAQAMALSMNMLMDLQDAEDACQEAFLRTYRNLGRFDSGRSFKNWFFAILANVCRDALRGRRRRRALMEKALKEDAVATVVRDPGAPLALDLGPSVLARLSPQERLCLHLWANEECSANEMAAVLGCSRPTASVYLHRARKKLKAALNEEKHA
ncbi:MAG: RNA polymerase sigma factor [Candidatus Aminicenantes bacterium]|nr:RNA polymerase sigma factor [Candidatus Aminicenantes bacterium]